MAIWTAILFVASLLSGALFMGPIYVARLQALQNGISPAPAIGSFVLIGLLFILLITVLWAAVFRAVMRPEERSFAYLRLGMDELRLLAAVLIIMVGGYLVFLILAVIIGFIGGIVGQAAGLSAGLAIGVLLGLALLVASIWVGVRLSVFGPLTILRRKIAIGSAWSLTRGAFWPLFGAYVIIGLILCFVYGLVFTVQMGSLFSDMANPNDPAAALRIAEWQAAQYGSPFSAWGFFSVILQAIIGGAALALQAGSTAIAADRLVGGGGAPNDLRAVYE
ncbi:hypothetical protein [Sphingomonas sp.]|uniref:hypothetical protein n=1 Tax=Sphingomonas sp. TaxID=28214 RepID=UPI003B3A65BA